MSSDTLPEAPASFWSALRIADIDQDLLRNIVAPPAHQDLFDDLSDDPAHTLLALEAEQRSRPAAYRSQEPATERPFEAAVWANAIGWPFRHWQASRHSDGSFGVWYGADTLETSVRESAHHWVHGFLADAGFERETVVGERQVYAVACRAALLDLRQAVPHAPGLLHPRCGIRPGRPLRCSTPRCCPGRGSTPPSPTASKAGDCASRKRPAGDGCPSSCPGCDVRTSGHACELQPAQAAGVSPIRLLKLWQAASKRRISMTASFRLISPASISLPERCSVSGFRRASSALVSP